MESPGVNEKEREAKYMLINIETQAHILIFNWDWGLSNKSCFFLQLEHSLLAMRISHLAIVHSSFAAHFFICTFSKYLLTAFHMPGTLEALGKVIQWLTKSDWVPVLTGLYNREGETDININCWRLSTLFLIVALSKLLPSQVQFPHCKMGWLESLPHVIAVRIRWYISGPKICAH